ncbi:AbiV family abortive infection protein [Sinorhizobium fredii]|uniref:AbiV family abortive infection protein n=1 Tax=Rhizobium fredii TaxID=380 RepID=UPI001F37B7E0|nr:AbiV family abortive infection protein [Sinorhizobium fredii]
MRIAPCQRWQIHPALRRPIFRACGRICRPRRKTQIAQTIATLMRRMQAIPGTPGRGLGRADQLEQKKVLAAFGGHAAKNKSNAYMLKGSEAETDAKARGDWEAAMEAFGQSQDEFHETSPRAKNASFTWTAVDGEFAAPSERITNEMLAEITERNADFLGHAQSGLEMLRRFEKRAG